MTYSAESFGQLDILSISKNDLIYMFKQPHVILSKQDKFLSWWKSLARVFTELKAFAKHFFKVLREQVLNVEKLYSSSFNSNGAKPFRRPVVLSTHDKFILTRLNEQTWTCLIGTKLGEVRGIRIIYTKGEEGKAAPRHSA